jgi:hypothetical protein
MGAFSFQFLPLLRGKTRQSTKKAMQTFCAPLWRAQTHDATGCEAFWREAGIRQASDVFGRKKLLACFPQRK